MSQQRIALVAVCVFGAVALVAAQRFDFDSCQQKLRQGIDQYSNTVRSTVQKFANNMQSTVDGSTNISEFQPEIDSLMGRLNGLANQGTNFDASQLASAYTGSLNDMTKLMGTAFRMYMKMPQGAMGNYMSFAQSMMSAQSQLMESMTSSCMPQAKSAQ